MTCGAARAGEAADRCLAPLPDRARRSHAQHRYGRSRARPRPDRRAARDRAAPDRWPAPATWPPWQGRAGHRPRADLPRNLTRCLGRRRGEHGVAHERITRAPGVGPGFGHRQVSERVGIDRQLRRCFPQRAAGRRRDRRHEAGPGRTTPAHDWWNRRAERQPAAPRRPCQARRDPTAPRPRAATLHQASRR